MMASQMQGAKTNVRQDKNGKSDQLRRKGYFKGLENCKDLRKTQGYQSLIPGKGRLREGSGSQNRSAQTVTQTGEECTHFKGYKQVLAEKKKKKMRPRSIQKNGYQAQEECLNQDMQVQGDLNQMEKQSRDVRRHKRSQLLKPSRMQRIKQFCSSKKTMPDQTLKFCLTNDLFQESSSQFCAF